MCEAVLEATGFTVAIRVCSRAIGGEVIDGSFDAEVELLCPLPLK